MKIHRILVSLMLAGMALGALAADWHVSPTGSDANTGVDWEQALASISNAVAQAGAGETIFVSNGLYGIGAEIVVDKAITLTGVGGADATHIRRTSANGRVIQLTDADAVLEGFSLSGGSYGTDKNGAGMYMTAGLLHSCVISNNIEIVTTGILGVGLHMTGGIASNIVVSQNYGKNSEGHGVYVETGAVLTDSVIRDNNRKPNGSARYKSGKGTVNIQGGTVSHCRITDNANGEGWACYGGGVYVGSGTLRASVIANNENSGSVLGAGGHGSSGAGVWLQAGLVENCLIVSNTVSYERGAWGGGGVYQAGGTLVNCTVAHNTSAVAAMESKTHLDIAGGYQLAGGVVSNTVIFGNTRLSGQGSSDISGIPGFESAFHHSCSPDLMDGVQSNMTDDPRFINTAEGDYRLGLDSPCRDAGGTLGPAVDLLGNVRPQDGTGDAVAIRDIGAYEAPDVNGDLDAFFSVDVHEAFTTHEATFTAHVLGSDQTGLTYTWNFGDGTPEGSGSVVSHTYTAMGHYDVSLTVSNTGSEVASWSWIDCIRVGAPVAYVSPSGSHTAPFDTWAKAATDILSAVQAAVVTPGGATKVVVSNGTYSVSSSAASIFINRGLTVESLSGAAETIVSGISGADVYPNFDLDHPDAIVDGFTSEKANLGAIVSRGTLRNCVLRDNYSDGGRVGDSGWGVGLRMYGGVAEGCSIVENECKPTTGVQGAGVWMTGASLLQNSLIASNTITGSGTAVSGAGVSCRDNLNRSVIRNCLILHNIAGSRSGNGGGVSLNGGRLENCTVVSNRLETLGAYTGGGVSCVAGSVTNTIIWGNVVAKGLTESIDNVTVASIPFCSFSCASELTTGEQGNISDDPQFVDVAAGNYRLAQDSPCINTGVNQDWMVGALDLDGLSRVNSRFVDMGAYEYIPPPGTAILIR